MYTSGTSGDPKGVVLTHETIAFSVRGLDVFLDQFEDKVLKIYIWKSQRLLMHKELDHIWRKYQKHAIKRILLLTCE